MDTFVGVNLITPESLVSVCGDLPRLGGAFLMKLEEWFCRYLGR